MIEGFTAALYTVCISSFILFTFLLWLCQFTVCFCYSQVDTASEVEELDVDVAPAPYTASRGAAKLQVFIARYRHVLKRQKM